MKALIVEDETPIRLALQASLGRDGWTVETSSDGIDALHQGRELPLDIIVLDLGLPGLSGLQVLQQWRTEGLQTPVLILTARGRWQEKVEGLEAGADDYLVKPFQTEELLARMRALVRRSAGHAKTKLEFGPLIIETSSQAVSMDKQDVELTGFEYRLLEYLALHAGEVISKSVLTEHLYAEDADRDSNVLEVLITRLRRKLDPNKTLNPIETLRGRGYRLRQEV